jgi:DNA-directed RNA polymerase subunit B
MSNYAIDLNPEDVKKTNNDDLTPSDMLELIHAEIKKKGIAGHHLKSMNNFYANGVAQIITNIFKVEATIMNARNKTDEDNLIKEVSFQVTFSDVKVLKPSTTSQKAGIVEPLYPGVARRQNATYSAPLIASMEVTATALFADGTTKIVTDKINGHKIAVMPIMVGTTNCNLFGMSRDQLRKIGEDPGDYGGYLIIDGSEWNINCLENTTNNEPHIYKFGHVKERIYLTIISKPGDAYENSCQLIGRIMDTGAIILECAYINYRKKQIPFYILLRAFGMTSDREIVDNIAYGCDNIDVVSESIKTILENAFNVPLKAEFNKCQKETDQSAIIDALSAFLNPEMQDRATPGKIGEEIIKSNRIAIYRMLDKFILPHLGLEPCDRIKKVRFICHLINKMIQTDLDIIEESDRNAFKNKRIHAAGPSLAKVLKTNFNVSVVKKIKERLRTAYVDNSFSDVKPADVIMSAIKPEDLEKAMIQAVNTGNGMTKIGGGREIPNRMDTQRVELKNRLNVILNLNKISISSSMSNKASDQSDYGRRFHPTPIYRICPARTAEGTQVGLKKEIACMASISQPVESFLLKQVLLADSTILRNVMPAEIGQLTKVMLNGDWIGCVKDSVELVNRYRDYRRYDKIHYETSIVWELLINEVKFWTDAGRLMCPLVIVYNNRAEYEAGARSGKPIKFHQWTTLTQEHTISLAMGRLGMDDLRAARIVEYVSADEQENYLVAMNIDILKAERTNVLKQFTHVGIDQAVFGIVALSAPLLNHSSAARTTIFTNQVVQSISWYSFNWPYRVDKNTALQYYIDRPLVNTISNKITIPTSQNIMVALTLTGWNQEDSIDLNKASVEAGMFQCAYFTYEEIKKEHGEIIGKIDHSRTINIKKNANYELVDANGIIKIGTVVNKGDVLVIKTVPIKEPKDGFNMADRSLLCRTGPLTVVDVVITFDEYNNQLIRIKMISTRPCGVGDKLSSRTGNKGIISRVVDAQDMPYTDDGMIPDIIVNAQSIPTRMAINQIIECLLGIYATKKGIFVDGTAFMKMDIPTIMAELEKLGIAHGGHRRLYNGKTGKWIDTLIFMGVTSYMRLLKFAIDDEYATNAGPVSETTHQPVGGRNNSGALKIGEMELWTLSVHGTMMALEEKLYKDSDETYIYICNTCGSSAVVVNEIKNIYKCNDCKDDAIISQVKSCWASNLLINYMNAMGVKTTFGLEEHKYLTN